MTSTMTFTQSIKTCFCKYADFNGRASRSELWWFFLFLTLVSFGASIIDCGWFNDCSFWEGEDVFGGGVLYWLWSIATILPAFAVGARRLHDIGRSGWWQLLAITLIGLIPLFCMYCFSSHKETNEFGEPVTTE